MNSFLFLTWAWCYPSRTWLHFMLQIHSGLVTFLDELSSIVLEIRVWLVLGGAIWLIPFNLTEKSKPHMVFKNYSGCPGGHYIFSLVNVYTRRTFRFAGMLITDTYIIIAPFFFCSHALHGCMTRSIKNRPRGLPQLTQTTTATRSLSSLSTTRTTSTSQKPATTSLHLTAAGCSKTS